MFEKKSAIQGKGLFAAKDFVKGNVILVFRGERISKEKANEIYRSGCDYMLQVSSDEFLFLTDNSRFLNHSCNPNSAFLFENGELVALKDIKQGEEVLFDYSANEDTNFSMNCRCGSNNCRQVILPYHLLTVEERRDISSIISPFLKKPSL